MNKNSILSYVKLYNNILDKHQIFLSERDFSNIYQLILLVFELDDLYDAFSQYPPSDHKLANIKKAMISLMPNHLHHTGKTDADLRAVSRSYLPTRAI